MIGLDVDGVIIDFKKGLDMVVSGMFPDNPIPMIIRNYYCAEEYGLTDEQFNAVINIYNFSPPDWLDASFEMRTSQFHGEDVCLISARSHIPQWVKDYVNRYFDLRYCFVGCDSKTKVKLCMNFGATHMVDDSLHVLRCIDNHNMLEYLHKPEWDFQIIEPVKYVQTWNINETKFVAI